MFYFFEIQICSEDDINITIQVSEKKMTSLRTIINEFEKIKVSYKGKILALYFHELLRITEMPKA